MQKRRYRKQHIAYRTVGLFVMLVLTILAIAGYVWNHRKASVTVSGTLQVSFLDVGQADSAVIQCGSHAMIIDGGNAEDSSYVYSYLQKRGIEHLDYMIATHPHEDHIGGLPGALACCDTDHVYGNTEAYASVTYEVFRRKVQEAGNILEIPEEGTVLPLGEAQVRILSCRSIQDGNENNDSIVVMVSFGNTRFLFMADGEAELEDALLDEDIECDVLKVGHHGSGTSSTKEFLKEADPSIMVISCGKDNDYGHPHASVLRRLSWQEGEIYRTDLQGQIDCISDGSTVGCIPEKNRDVNVYVSGDGEIVSEK